MSTEESETTAPEPTTILGSVAVVGFPNAGKSTLINRLSGSRRTVVDAEPGVTRDRNEVVCEWNGESFLLVHTPDVKARLRAAGQLLAQIRTRYDRSGRQV